MSESSGLIENNNIYKNGVVGIQATKGSSIIVRHNKIFCNNYGIFMQKYSTGIIDTNEVYMNSLKNVFIINSSESILKRNRIYGGQVGVYLNYFSGTLEQNNIYEHGLGVEIR